MGITYDIYVYMYMHTYMLLSISSSLFHVCEMCYDFEFALYVDNCFAFVLLSVICFYYLPHYLQSCSKYGLKHLINTVVIDTHGTATQFGKT